MANAQKAFVLPKKGGPQEVQGRPIPMPKDNQILVRNESAALNPVDYKMADLGIFVKEYPTILGVDGSGVVEEVGPKVTRFKKGDRVVNQAEIGDALTSTFQQYSLAAEYAAAKIPDFITFDQASTFPVGIFTSVVGLYHDLQITPPWKGKHTDEDYILIWGGATSVGQYGIQLAKLSGFTVITTASPHNHEHLKALGASYVFDYRDPEVTNKIKAIVGDNLTYVMDNAGGDAEKPIFELLSSTKPSRLSVPTALPGMTRDIPDAYSHKQITAIRPYGISYSYPELAAAFWSNFETYLAEGKIVPNSVQVISGGLAAIARGQDLQRAGKVSNVKLVVHPQETA